MSRGSGADVNIIEVTYRECMCERRSQVILNGTSDVMFSYSAVTW